MSGQEYIEKIRDFLRKLSSAFPAFSAVHIVTDTGTEPIDLHGERFSDDVVAQFPKEWAYINKDDARNKAFSLTSFPAIAFSASFTSAPRPGAEVCSISTAMGQTDDSVSSIIFKLPPEMEDFSSIGELFNLVISFWSPNHGLVTRTNFGDALSQPVGDIRVGWMTYIKGTAARSFVPEPFTAMEFHGGTLICGMHNIPSRDGSDIVPDLIRLRDALASGGLLTNPRKKKRA